MEAEQKAIEELRKVVGTRLSPYINSTLLDDPEQVTLLTRLFQTDSPRWTAAFSSYLEKHRLWAAGGRPFERELSREESEAFRDFDYQRHLAFVHCQEGEIWKRYQAVKNPNWYHVNTKEDDFYRKGAELQTVDEMRAALKGILETSIQQLQLGIRQETCWSEFYAILAQQAGLRIVPGLDNNKYAGLAE